MMDRHDMERWLNEYLDGTLSKNDRDQVAERIEKDPNWAKEYESLEALRNRTNALPRTITPSRDLWPGIATQIRRDPEPVMRRGFWSFLPQWAPAGIALAAAVIIAILMHPSESPVRHDRAGGSFAETQPRILPAVVQALDYECRGAGKHLVASVHELMTPLGGIATASIQTDLDILESAIEETRSALENDPDNTRVLRILTELYEQKLSLLHRAMQLTRVA